MSLWPYIRPGDAGSEQMQDCCARTLDPDALRGEIRAAIALGELDDAVPSDRLVIRPLAIKKDRFIVGLQAADHRSRLQLIAKGYVAADRAARVLANHRRLWETGLGDSTAAVRTSRPFGLISSLSVMLMEALPGKHPIGADIDAAARAGHAAAMLHACPAQLEPHFELDAALTNVERHARLLEGRDPVIAARAQMLAGRARALQERFADVPRSPLNGDLWLGSLLLDGGSTYLIDWDIACSFDAAWDVGHYLVQLFRDGLRNGEDAARSRAAFLDAYLAREPFDGSFDERVGFHEALVAIHKTYTVIRVGGEEAAFAGALLDLADMRLAAWT